VAAGVRLDRAGSALLYKLYVYGDALRVTDLADFAGVDAPTVTAKSNSSNANSSSRAAPTRRRAGQPDHVDPRR